MSNQKRIGLEGTIKAVRRLFENYHNDPEIIEHRAASGKRRKTPADCSGEGQAVLCVQTAKKRPFSLTQNQPPKTGKVDASACPSHSAQAEWELGTLATDNIVRHSRRAEITTLHEILWMRPRVPPTPPR